MDDRTYISLTRLSTFHSKLTEWINSIFVTKATTINGKELNENITLTPSDIGADVEGAASDALAEAKNYTDTEVANLVNSAPEKLDTLGELATALEENNDIVEVLNAAITNKAEASDLTSHTSNTANPHNVTASQLGLSYETWTFTLNDGSVVTKKMVVM